MCEEGSDVDYDNIIRVALPVVAVFIDAAATICADEHRRPAATSLQKPQPERQPSTSLALDFLKLVAASWLAMYLYGDLGIGKSIDDAKARGGLLPAHLSVPRQHARHTGCSCPSCPEMRLNAIVTASISETTNVAIESADDDTI